MISLMEKVYKHIKMVLNFKVNLKMELNKVKNVNTYGQMVKYTLDHLNKVLCKAMVY